MTHIDIGGTQANRFGQRHLLYITANYKNVQHLRIAQECSDSGPALDFTKVKVIYKKLAAAMPAVVTVNPNPHCNNLQFVFACSCLRLRCCR